LDSGASNGIRCSNTELLEKQYGWAGICVEPDPQFFQELTQNRACTRVNCCLYDFNGTVPFVRAGSLSGVRDELGLNMLGHIRTALGLKDDAPLEVGSAPCRTVASVLKECGAPMVIDYWSLDTEGSELTILRSFPFHEYLVRMITVEHNWGVNRVAIRELLRRQGLVWVAQLACDDVYVHRSVMDLRAARRSRALRRRQPSAIARSRPSSSERPIAPM
jgi:FkbM family methyltransferase